MSSLEDQIADEYAALRDEGFDPATARAAIRKLDASLVEKRVPHAAAMDCSLAPIRVAATSAATMTVEVSC
jgi:hypothetical protein